MSFATLGHRIGTVTSFDDDRGTGRITDESGRSVHLHCTGIADGSRTIAAGTAVRFELMAGRGGLVEAWSVRPR